MQSPVECSYASLLYLVSCFVRYQVGRVGVQLLLVVVERRFVGS
jgi:hypothetical protein